jgi:hypothetical protein
MTFRCFAAVTVVDAVATVPRSVAGVAFACTSFADHDIHTMSRAGSGGPFRLPLIQPRELGQRLLDHSVGDDDDVFVLAGYRAFDQFVFGVDEVDGGVALLGPHVHGAGDLSRLVTQAQDFTGGARGRVPTAESPARPHAPSSPGAGSARRPLGRHRRRHRCASVSMCPICALAAVQLDTVDY